MNRERWHELSFHQQMGNIGSEIGRVIHWHEKKDEKSKEDALWRALELIDLTILGRPNKELFRLREVVCDLFLDKNNYNVTLEWLKNYFMDFAILAQK